MSTLRNSRREMQTERIMAKVIIPYAFPAPLREGNERELHLLQSFNTLTRTEHQKGMELDLSEAEMILVSMLISVLICSLGKVELLTAKMVFSHSGNKTL